VTRGGNVTSSWATVVLRFGYNGAADEADDITHTVYREAVKRYRPSPLLGDDRAGAGPVRQPDRIASDLAR
jgi:hypothetical protein